MNRRTWKYITNVGPTKALIVEEDGSTVMDLHTNVTNRSQFAADVASIVRDHNTQEALCKALQETVYELALLVGKDHSTVVDAQAALRQAYGLTEVSA